HDLPPMVDLVASRRPNCAPDSTAILWHDRNAPLNSAIFVLLVLALGHRWLVTASWFTSDKTCGERYATPWFVERLDIDCGRLLRAGLWKLYDEGQFRRSRRGEGAVEYMKHLEHPDE